MPHQLTTSYIKDSTELFRYYKKLVERALAQCPDEGLFTALDEESNCIAIIVKHMAGNMRSRWKDFLTTDGEKPDRKRDTEFESPPASRAALMEMWEQGWAYVFNALEPLPDDDRLWDLENVLVSPHSASTVATENEDLVTLFLENLDHWRRGEPLRNRYDPLAGY